VNQYLELAGDEQLDKKHPAVVNMAAWVETQYRQGRTTAIASEEMLELVHEHLPEYLNRSGGRLSATIQPEVGPSPPTRLAKTTRTCSSRPNTTSEDPCGHERDVPPLPLVGEGWGEGR